MESFSGVHKFKSVLSQASSNPNVLTMEPQILSWESQVIRRVVCHVSHLEGYNPMGSGMGNITIWVSGKHHIPRESCLCIKN